MLHVNRLTKPLMNSRSNTFLLFQKEMGKPNIYYDENQDLEMNVKLYRGNSNRVIGKYKQLKCIYNTICGTTVILWTLIL